MNLIDLEAFVSVVDHGSMWLPRRAAPYPIGSHAESPESRGYVGVLLLDRQTRPLQPTLADGRPTSLQGQCSAL